MFQPHLKYTLTFFNTYTSRSRSFITTHFVPVLVKGLYQTESYSSYCFLASELSIEKIIKYSRQAANSQSMGFAINISHTQ
jgi:hypothetical protein